MANVNDKPKNFFDFLKDYIALSIVIFSFIVLVYLIYQANAGNYVEKDTRAKDTMGLILPLLGTWMGTILAFYFTKENFESASRSMQETIRKLTPDEKLKSTKVTDAGVMIPLDKIQRFTFTDTTMMNTPVVNYIAYLDEAKQNRLVLLENNLAKYVIHKSVLNDFVYRQLTKSEIADLASVKTCTLDNILSGTGNNEIKNTIINSVEFVSQDATLFDAQQKMNNNKYCQDVFVTKSGQKDEPVLGWITNVIVAEKARV